MTEISGLSDRDATWQVRSSQLKRRRRLHLTWFAGGQPQPTTARTGSVALTKTRRAASDTLVYQPWHAGGLPMLRPKRTTIKP